MITVIVSVFNEIKNPYLSKILRLFKRDPFFEVICVDGGSTDGTVEWIKQQDVCVHVLNASTRAARLNFGIKQASAAMILLHHPRSVISDAGIQFIKEKGAQFEWAAFTHAFDHPHFFLKFISWYSNQVRVKKKAIVYLDHCMLVKKSYLDVKPIPDIAIFEDTALSENLNVMCQPTLLPYVATTSAIRFLDRGIYKQFILNQGIKCLYALNVNSQTINRLYERQLNLNQEN
ncbi:MAG: glycosyltransferase [Gammaproteobacteria bacterium]|nr:glycosyltransferase [Gammaproteobacteria bacterium]